MHLKKKGQIPTPQLIQYIRDGQRKEIGNMEEFEDSCTARHNWITGARATTH